MLLKKPIPQNLTPEETKKWEYLETCNGLVIDVDYGSSAFWTLDGKNIFCAEDLPISEELLKRSQSWAENYWNFLTSPDDIDEQEWDKEGQWIIKRTFEELGEYIDVYDFSLDENQRKVFIKITHENLKLYE